MTKLKVVIHVKDVEHALRETEVAMDCGADGVFLINHGISPITILDSALYINDRLGDIWIGVNLLGVLNQEAIKLVKDINFINGLWCDNAHINDDGSTNDMSRAIMFKETLSDSHIKYFGGFAFKYQVQPNNLAEAAIKAKEFVDIITTSGPATGRAAELFKISEIKKAIGNHPLAVASGITPDNAYSYLPHVDYMLVATGISKNFEELDPIKVKQLVEVINA